MAADLDKQQHAFRCGYIADVHSYSVLQLQNVMPY